MEKKPSETAQKGRKYGKTLKKPSKISKNQQKCRKTEKTP